MKGLAVVALLGLFAFNAMDARDEADSPDPERLRNLLNPYFKVIGQEGDVSEKSGARIDLGRVLFHDKRLSGSSEISCNDCHDLTKYGTNGVHYEKLLKEKKITRDVPSIYNKGYLKLFDWDGAHVTLESKTAEAIQSEHEMNMPDEDLLIKRLKSIPGYQPLFEKAFPGKEDPIRFDTLLEALVLFEKALVTPAPIDRFIAGDDKALSAEQLTGGFLFDQKYCSTCHTGTMFGGQMLQKLGAANSWPNQEDVGYFNKTRNPDHKMVFRVSALRNVEKTAPYFHDASSTRLWGAVRKISWHELGQFISIQEALNIQAFLEALTGEIPKPTLPE